jgi:hypothetical protein
MIGAAVGAVFGGSAAELINSAIPGNAAVAQPQAYALVRWYLFWAIVTLMRCGLDISLLAEVPFNLYQVD